MKKLILSFVPILLFAVSGFGQTLKSVKIDSLVSVSLPAGYQQKDTLGQQLFTANAGLGYMVILRTPNAKNTPPLKKETDLNKILKDDVKSIQNESSNASAQYVRDTTIGTLKARTFTLQTDNGQGDVQLRNIVLFYTKDANYTFEYTYPQSRSDLVKTEYKTFVNSIKLSPELQRNDQYLSSAKGMSPVLQIGLIGGGGLLLIITLVMYIQKKRRLEY